MIEVTGGSRRIELGNELVALVDEDDYRRLRGRRYYAKKCRGKTYAARQGTQGPPTRSGQRNFVPLSRDVLGSKSGQRIKHLNGDTLDCRRSNLKPEAGQVYRMRHVERKRYVARMRVDGARHFLGCWPKREWAEDACRRAEEAARELRGRGLSAARVRRELRRAVGLEA